jgi:methyl-accepting chemotaxis protein
MFKALMKFVPQMDQAALKKMEAQLSARFRKVAKSFGRGLKGALQTLTMTGGPIAIALGFLTKMLSPLREIQEAMDNILSRSNDIATNARHFGADAGKLIKLSEMAKIKGLDENSLFMLMSKFQNAVAEAEADPSKPSSVSNFVGSKDIADAFFEFIQTLQDLNKTDQNRSLLVQKEVFGEKQILKASDFINADFKELLKALGVVSAKDLGKSVKNMADLDLKDKTLEARRNLVDFMDKGSIINQDFINEKDKREKQRLADENANLRLYTSLSKMDQGMAEIIAMMQRLMGEVTKIVVKVTELSASIKQLSISRVFKGLFGGGN